MTDDEWIEQFLKEAETDDFGIAVFFTRGFEPYTARSLQLPIEHWSTLIGSSVENSSCVSIEMLARKDNFHRKYISYWGGYWHITFAIQRFLRYLLPTASHEERLTGYLVAALVLTGTKFRSDIRFYVADASTAKAEKLTGSDILLAVRWTDNTDNFVSFAFIQVKKFVANGIRVNLDQHQQLLNTGCGHYLCLDHRSPRTCSVFPAQAVTPMCLTEEVIEDEVVFEETMEEEDDTGHDMDMHEEGKAIGKSKIFRYNEFDVDLAMFMVFRMTSIMNSGQNGKEGTREGVHYISGDDSTLAEQSANFLDQIGWRPLTALVVDLGTGFDGMNFLNKCSYDGYSVEPALNRPKRRPRRSKQMGSM